MPPIPPISSYLGERLEEWRAQRGGSDEGRKGGEAAEGGSGEERLGEAAGEAVRKAGQGRSSPAAREGVLASVLL
eukprot:CAMPEP_0185479004 /NCGR_PEP_ID=MMETSP1366-20130426/5162_1 /TAXON_ID=38817 /ORGANISM="Gephyrocapsa oceanica, Strain RCC1303" /LENGTH=74 /DNA_ID=CAMNT_0028086327 /DNA_START=8 /DNA_END=229 /DNA_ORIENTATION=-